MGVNLAPPEQGRVPRAASSGQAVTEAWGLGWGPLWREAAGVL